MFRHIHIVSCSPRSGTTLLHEAMVTCFHVDKHYDHEIRFNLVSGKDGELVISKRPKDIMCMAMHSVRPIAPTSIGVWKQHLPRIQGQQDLHGSLTPDLVACGYERSADWEHVLHNVQPDVSRSLYAEKVNFWTRLFQRISAKNKVRMYRRKRQN